MSINNLLNIHDMLFVHLSDNLITNILKLNSYVPVCLQGGEMTILI